MRFRQVLAATILAVAIGGPTVELFDHWDHTLQDGNDIEGTAVVVALCAGFAVGISAARARARTTLARTADVVSVRPRLTSHEHAPVRVLLFGASPPVPLRI